MTQDQKDPDDPTFDLDSFVEEADEQMKQEWPFEIDDDGNFVQQSLSWRQKAKIGGTMAIGHALQLVYATVFFFLLIVGVTFLMNLFGVAIPVA